MILPAAGRFHDRATRRRLYAFRSRGGQHKDCGGNVADGERGALGPKRPNG